MGREEKVQTGTVVSNKMDKTVVVRVDRHKRHRLYGKTLRTTRRYKAHDQGNECRLGDIVRISETRPLSREKRWRVVEVVTKGDVAEVAPREIGAHILEETRAAADAEAAARAEAEHGNVEATPAVGDAVAPADTAAPLADEAAPPASEADPEAVEASEGLHEAGAGADVAPLEETQD